MKTKSKKNSFKKGDFVSLKEIRYKKCYYIGAVTEVFDDIIQIYGVNYRGNLGFHEVDRGDVLISKIDKERAQFSIDQGLRQIEQKKLKVEISYKNFSMELQEQIERRREYFGESI